MENILAMISEKPWILLIVALWIIPWKGWALWKAARRNQAGWFVVLLIVNTLAILDIFYIFLYRSKKEKKNEEKLEQKSKLIATHNLNKPKLTIQSDGRQSL